MKSNHVTLNVEEGIGTIEFFTERSNSLPSNVLKQLTDTFVKAGNDASIIVIILRSGGNQAFCAGADFDELTAIQNEDEGEQFFQGFANLINAMRKTPKFIIGRVQGKAIGGGVGLAAATDYCFATQHAAIKLSELQLGIGPFVVSPVIARKMGKSTLQELGINASDFHDAQWASQRGLYAQVFENVAEMDDTILQLAKKLAEYNPEAMKELKHVFWSETSDWDQLLPMHAKISGRLVTSEFTKAFIHKFRKK